jgi:glucose/mannose-6-phosphate isomerase
MSKSALDLDHPRTHERGDPGGMRERIAHFPTLLQKGWDAAGALRLPASYREATTVLCHGMGGSAIAGDLAADLLRYDSKAPPLTVHRDYGLPAWVDERTLVIASSASGGTEETLSGLPLALERRAKVVALTGGGALAEKATAAGLPVCPVPLSGPPRTLLPYALGALLRLLSGLGMAALDEAGFRAAAQHVAALQKRLDPSIGTAQNSAKALAHAMRGRLPVIYGSHVLAAVGRRWKGQLNENAKSPAFAEELPEAHHNSVVGLGGTHPELQRLFVVLLTPRSAPERLRLRALLTADMLAEQSIPYHSIEPSGGTPLAEVLEATLLGDYVSYYLALLDGQDPTPITAIDRIKARLVK